MLAAPVPGQAQVFVVQPVHIESHYTHFTPTNIQLPRDPLTTLDREELIRFLQSEQGFAMRPLPVSTLTLHVNGGMDPTGDKYVDELHRKGIAAKPGDRVVVTDIRIHDNSIILDLNNGPFHKHRFLRHISVGTDPYYSTPIVADNGLPPGGSRITLLFPSRIPDLNGQQVEALLKPMIDFGVKSPAEAYAESLPNFLRVAIEQHRVLVGMSRDMVRYARGEPIRKVRETEDGKPVEIWIYGEAPEPVEFVRFNGDYVVRVELARVGEPILVRASNEMGDYWGDQPAVAATNQHEIQLGDRTEQAAQEESAPKAPPSLRNPGEKLPSDDPKNPRPVMAPVNFPKDQQRPGDPGYTPTVSAKPSGTAGSSSAGTSSSGTPATPSAGSGSSPSATSGSGASKTTPPADEDSSASNPLDAPSH